MSLKHTNVLVIGGTSGIGLGVAHAVADRGATPYVASRHQTGVDRALAELPDGARGATVDLTDPRPSTGSPPMSATLTIWCTRPANHSNWLRSQTSHQRSSTASCKRGSSAL